jgi:hypothetical protein
VRLGEVYYGFGEYQKTIDAITQGLQKGSVTHMDEALVYLGLAQVQLKSRRRRTGSSALQQPPS